MDLSTFKKQSTVFEIRYDPAYLLWDNAGIIWSDVKKLWPEIEHLSAKPNQTTFTLGDDTTFTIQLDKTHITFYNQKLKDMIKIQSDFLTLLIRHLKIVVYTRIGYRIFFYKKYKSQEDASDALLALGLIKNLPDKKHFNIEGRINEPEYKIRWEDEYLGVSLRLKTQRQKINFRPPPEILDEFESKHIERDAFIIDIDYYTNASMKTGQFDLAEWVSQADRAIRRDLNTILEGHNGD